MDGQTPLTHYLFTLCSVSGETVTGWHYLLGAGPTPADALSAALSGGDAHRPGPGRWRGHVHALSVDEELAGCSARMLKLQWPASFQGPWGEVLVDETGAVREDWHDDGPMTPTPGHGPVTTPRRQHRPQDLGHDDARPARA